MALGLACFSTSFGAVVEVVVDGALEGLDASNLGAKILGVPWGSSLLAPILGGLDFEIGVPNKISS